jgi:plastocyanin
MVFLCLSASALGASGVGSDAAVPQHGKAKHVVNITVENMAFAPSKLTVHVGDQVIFANKDLFPHTVTADDKSFDSGGIAPNANWRYTATAPGTYSYSCSFHPTMHGTLTVR